MSAVVEATCRSALLALFKIAEPFQSSFICPYTEWAPQEVAKEVRQVQTVTPSRLHSSFSLTWSECGSDTKSLGQPCPGSVRELYLDPDSLASVSRINVLLD